MSAMAVHPSPASSLFAALLLVACGGNTGMQSVIQQPAPVTAPPRFVPLDPANVIAPADTLAGDGCLTPMRDPVTGVEIVLVRSESGLGDYDAPSGAYGMRDDQLIRLECNTGRVIGVVRR
ncbi:MAG: hypothetical protein R2910_12175 [Gemmatimonadales bacterium]|jgi:hypothetical protein